LPTFSFFNSKFLFLAEAGELSEPVSFPVDASVGVRVPPSSVGYGKFSLIVISPKEAQFKAYYRKRKIFFAAAK